MSEKIYQQLAINRGDQIAILEKETITDADQKHFIELRKKESDLITELNQVIPEILEKQWTESSNIARTKYIPEEGILEIEFRNGGIYQYSGFPMTLWNELLATPSIGTFIAKKVKGFFAFIQAN